MYKKRVSKTNTQHNSFKKFESNEYNKVRKISGSK